MAHDDQCIFCKIINGDIPSAKVYEDEYVFAFLDLSQVTKGHTLVIPKDHQANLFELQEDTAANLFRAVPKIANAIKAAFGPAALNVLNNNGELAGQTVFHFHIHLLPRYDKKDGFGLKWETHEEDYTSEDRAILAEKIADAID
jgi:histidine triad (HIT) family protein